MIEDISKSFPEGMERKMLWENTEFSKLCGPRELQPEKRKQQVQAFIDVLNIDNSFSLIDLARYMDWKCEVNGKIQWQTSHCKKYLQSYIKSEQIKEISKRRKIGTIYRKIS